MSLRKQSKDKKLVKSCEETIITDVPEQHTVLGPDLDMVCTIKRLKDNTVKHICMSETNEVLRYLVLYLLDHCIDQIHILCGGRSGSSHLAFFDDILKNKTEDCKSSIYEPIYDKNSGEPFKVAFRKRQTNKFYSDSEKLKEFLVAIKNELKEFYSFQLFRRVIHDVKIKMREAQILFQQTVENEIKMKELKLALITQGRESNSEIHKANKACLTSYDTVQELMFKNIIELRYAKAYENCRCEQNQIKNERNLRELQIIISKYRNYIKNEKRVHGEILSYIIDNQKELRDNTKNWIDNYNADMESSQLLILQIKNHLEDIQKYSAKLKKLFAEHKKSIKEFKEYKEKKHKKEEEEQRLVCATIRIQAWWRGTMYRRQLGPYNPNKPKKGKGKNKKKKK